MQRLWSICNALLMGFSCGSKIGNGGLTSNPSSSNVTRRGAPQISKEEGTESNTIEEKWEWVGRFEVDRETQPPSVINPKSGWSGMRWAAEHLEQMHLFRRAMVAGRGDH
ncbi:hypothetical protein CEXT_204631 [Caerostris extrusa]|uniref:Uncharacterized protein n=1 Tax=Caerostris extrusa TaxID=172846 RepID=A0AAV4MQK4_CAEEX|nr:hypothetical protein CEXT_204631 [Caerostris extrusa]